LTERWATVLAALALVIVFATAHPVLDPDMWWHLAVGDAILRHQSVRFADPLSFTHTAVWVNAQWLSESLFAALCRLVGLTGLELLALVVKVTAFLFVFAAMEAPPLTRVWVTFLFAFGALPVMGGVRPQLFSFLLLALLAFWLHRQRSLRQEKVSPATYLLVPSLFALWANLHSFYPLAFTLLFLTVIADWWNEGMGWQPVLGVRWRRQMGLLLALCALATTVTPFGWHSVKQVLVNIVQSSKLPIEEWQPALFLRHPMVMIWAGLLLLWLACLAWSPKRADAWEMLWGAFATVSALTGVRMLAVWCLLMAPFVGAHLGRWLANLPSRQETPRWLPVATLALCALLAGFLIAAKFSPPEFRKRERTEYPLQATAWLFQRKLLGNCLTRYDWGGYVAWRLKGRVRVFVDGRADFYPLTIMRDFLTAYFGKAKWRDVLDRYKVTLVLVPPDAPLANLLALTEGWRLLYRDRQAVIFQRVMTVSPLHPPTKPRKEVAGKAEWWLPLAEGQ